MTNAELAQKLRDLRDFLIIAGYEGGHATRYTHLARHIEKMAEPIETVRREGRLRDIPGVGPLVAMYIKEILEDGVSSKQRDWEKEAPITVLQLVRIPGLGAKTARRLFLEFGIASGDDLRRALREGVFREAVGLGPTTLKKWEEALKAADRGSDGA